MPCTFWGWIFILVYIYGFSLFVGNHISAIIQSPLPSKSKTLLSKKKKNLNFCGSWWVSLETFFKQNSGRFLHQVTPLEQGVPKVSPI